MRVLVNSLTYNTNRRYSFDSFESRKQLFDFGIESDLSLNEYKPIPVLKPEYHKSQTNLNFNLEDGFNQAYSQKKLIPNYDNYRKQTWIHFLRCLQKHNTIAEEEPDFVSLTPRLCDLLTVEEYDSSF